MMQSHAGYSRCGLGSDGTDRLVALVRQEQAMARLHQEAPVLYGAKITGGGSGGHHQSCFVHSRAHVADMQHHLAAAEC